MSLLYQFDVLMGNSALHDKLVQKMYERQLATYTRVIAADAPPARSSRGYPTTTSR